MFPGLIPPDPRFWVGQGGGEGRGGVGLDLVWFVNDLRLTWWLKSSSAATDAENEFDEWVLSAAEADEPEHECQSARNVERCDLSVNSNNIELIIVYVCSRRQATNNK